MFTQTSEYCWNKSEKPFRVYALNGPFLLSIILFYWLVHSLFLQQFSGTLSALFKPSYTSPQHFQQVSPTS